MNILLISNIFVLLNLTVTSQSNEKGSELNIQTRKVDLISDRLFTCFSDSNIDVPNRELTLINLVIPKGHLENIVSSFIIRSKVKELSFFLWYNLLVKYGDFSRDNLLPFFSGFVLNIKPEFREVPHSNLADNKRKVFWLNPNIVPIYTKDEHVHTKNIDKSDDFIMTVGDTSFKVFVNDGIISKVQAQYTMVKNNPRTTMGIKCYELTSKDLIADGIVIGSYKRQLLNIRIVNNQEDLEGEMIDVPSTMMLLSKQLKQFHRDESDSSLEPSYLRYSEMLYKSI